MRETAAEISKRIDQVWGRESDFSFGRVLVWFGQVAKQGGKKCEFHTNFCNRRRMNAKIAEGVEMRMEISDLKSV